MGEQTIKWVGLRRSLRVLWKEMKVILPIVAVLGLFIFINQFSFSIQLEGDEKILLEYGETYHEPGAGVVITGAFLREYSIPFPFLRVETVSDLQENVLGRYTVTYSASFFWHPIQAQRQVCVIDTVCPEITFTRDYFADSQAGESMLMHGITALDNYDGDITDKVVCTRTTGWVTYSVVDSSGNPAYVVRELPESADQPPQILLKGESQHILSVGEAFVEPGYTAEDILDGDLTREVTVEGTVDHFTPGVYPLVYSVTDKKGNTASVTREVIVEAKARPEIRWPQEKTIYLTFDDGPGPYTKNLLNILKKYDVKATFFVTDSDYNDLMQDIVRDGHSIGIHTVSHNYAEVYASPEAFFEDLRSMQNIIYHNTGVMTSLMRFPGGSSNMISKRTSEGLMTLLTEAVQDAGYQYFDWNVDSGDAGGTNEQNVVAENIMEGVSNQTISIVLQHDIHSYSVNAVEDVIRWGKENGYTFRALTEYSPGFHHDVQN